MTGQDVNIKEGTVLTEAKTLEKVLDNTRPEINSIPITKEEVNRELPEYEAQKVLEVINEYKDLIARNLHQIGCTDMGAMRIALNDATPYSRRPNRVLYSKRKQLQNIIRDLEEADMIEDSKSTFSSPVLHVQVLS